MDQVQMEEKRPDFFEVYLNPDRQQAANEGIPFEVDFEITTQCLGACSFCFTNSLAARRDYMPTEKVLETIDQLSNLGIRQIWWEGGDPLLHPGVFEALDYAHSKGLRSALFCSGLPLNNKSMVKKVYQYFQERRLNLIGIHIDSLNQEVYDQVHTDPKGLAQKVQGYKNLLEAGFPPDRILPCLTLSEPALRTIEDTIDWYVDEMGANFVELTVFKPHGTGSMNRHLEPPLSGLKRAFEYRAKKLGNPKWLQMATTECSSIRCKTNFYICWDGVVKICPCVPADKFSVGNIYEEGISQIFAKQGKKLTHNDLKIKGQCAHCKNNQDNLCWGCRANAFHYLGDFEAADPKCWLNPEAKELYL